MVGKIASFFISIFESKKNNKKRPQSLNKNLAIDRQNGFDLLTFSRSLI